MGSCRIATLADANRATRLLLDFYKATKQPYPLSAAWARNTFCECVTMPSRLALMTDHGLLLAQIAPSMIGPYTQAMEIAWWTAPDHRGEGLPMLARYEAWAKDMRATITTMTSLALFPEVEAIYRARGYVPVETLWVKAK